ncbi:ACT domain-containing protein [Methanococcoides sp. LMO-2]|uniref:ACT domain-containing protein n=1 Tax=Methanococcoides cohabitans TaxID=3136559 RepID=A0ABU9KSJ9_9EURY
MKIILVTCDKNDSDLIQMKNNILNLTLLKNKFGVCRLEGDNSIPEWADSNEICSITRTAEELSIVCPEENIPSGIICEKDWKCLKVEGPLDFSLIGILARISNLLAEEKISIFVISTYNTDYILVREADVKATIEKLSANGYMVSDEKEN